MRTPSTDIQGPTNKEDNKFIMENKISVIEYNWIIHPHMSFMFISNARSMLVLTERKLISYIYTVGKQPAAQCIVGNKDDE